MKVKEADLTKFKRFQEEIPILEKELTLIIPKSYTIYDNGLLDKKEDEKYEVRRIRNQIRWREQEIQRILRMHLWN